MHQGGFYSFPSQEEFWAYWSRYIFINRYQNAPKSVHEVLLELVRDFGCHVRINARVRVKCNRCISPAFYMYAVLNFTQKCYHDL